MKTVAVILALVAWYAIQGTIGEEEEVVGVPIEIPVEEGWAILNRSITEATVTFRGTKDAIRELDQDRLRLIRDIRGHQEQGYMLLNLHPRNVDTPDGVRAVKIEPDQMNISLDREGVRPIPVKAVIQGELPDGFEVGEIKCTPATVQLFGPEQKLNEIEVVHTESIDMENQVGTFKLRRNIVPPSQSWIGYVQPDYVIVDVEVIERSSHREFAAVPIAAMMGAGRRFDVELSATNTMVVLEGRNEVLEAISQQSIQAYVDCRVLTAASTSAVPVRVHPPVGVLVKSVDPEEVYVKLSQPGEDS
jgi:YbbR domain-containing protein